MTSEGAPAAGGWRAGGPAQDEQTTFDTSVAHVARVYDYWLGGKDNFAVDRAALGQAKDRVGRLMPVEQTYRTHAEVMQFFDGLEMVEPGLVRVQEWRPRSEMEAKSPAALWGGVGRKL